MKRSPWIFDADLQKVERDEAWRKTAPEHLLALHDRLLKTVRQLTSFVSALPSNESVVTVGQLRTAIALVLTHVSAVTALGEAIPTQHVANLDTELSARISEQAAPLREAASRIRDTAAKLDEDRKRLHGST